MKKLVLASILLAMAVIVLGAYTRLTDAGLGCPDWPGCYGHLTVGQAAKNIEQAQQLYPERPFEAHKAWNEMVHRYFASALGLCIVVIFVLSVMQRNYHRPLKLPFFLVCLVIFQGMLGMWTVTLNLLPVVVMGHLLGGFSVLCGLYLLYLRMTPYRIPGGDHRMRAYGKYALTGIVIVTAQIALGGWTSANYAALACTNLPLCEGQWLENLDFAGAFSVPDAHNYEFGAHDYAERMTMHMTHRAGAVLTFLYLSWLALRIYKAANAKLIKRLCALMMIVLGVQIILGVSNIVFSLPIVVALLHNFVAVCLLLVMITLSYTLYRKT